MKGSAPNLPLAGSHFVPVMNPSPSRWKIGQACLVVTYAINARIASTESPAPRATARKTRSPHTSEDRRDTVGAVTARELCRDLELGELRRCLRHLRRGKRRVPGGVGLALALRIDVLE